MANKHINYDGLLYFWQKIKAKLAGKVDVVEGKGLSTNDYTTPEKTKLAGIEEGATNTVVENVLTSDSTTNALSAAQGKALKQQIDAINTGMEDLGAGDMLKSVYDTNNNGQVDKADDSDSLGGVASVNYALKTDIPTVTNDLTDALKNNYDAAYTHSQQAHAPAGAQANVIEGVQVNGEDIALTSKKANITVPTKVSDLANDSGFLTEHQDISGKADVATSLAGYGITDAYTKTEVDSKLSSVYKFKGSVETYSALPTDSQTVGDVYNVKQANKTNGIKAGDNVAWDGTAWDVLAGTVDLTDYVLSSDIEFITNEEIDTIMAS